MMLVAVRTYETSVTFHHITRNKILEDSVIFYVEILLTVPFFTNEKVANSYRLQVKANMQHH